MKSWKFWSEIIKVPKIGDTTLFRIQVSTSSTFCRNSRKSLLPSKTLPRAATALFSSSQWSSRVAALLLTSLNFGWWRETSSSADWIYRIVGIQGAVPLFSFFCTNGSTFLKDNIVYLHWDNTISKENLMEFYPISHLILFHCCYTSTNLFNLILHEIFSSHSIISSHYLL